MFRRLFGGRMLWGLMGAAAGAWIVRSMNARRRGGMSALVDRSSRLGRNVFQLVQGMRRR